MRLSQMNEYIEGVLASDVEIGSGFSNAESARGDHLSAFCVTESDQKATVDAVSKEDSIFAASDGVESVLRPTHPLIVALRNRAAWPGVVVWNLSGEAEFASCDVERIEQALSRVRRLPSTLAIPTAIQTLASMRGTSASRPVDILHLSDLHIGKPHVEARLPLLLARVRSIKRSEADTYCVVTGDIFDSPSEANYKVAVEFLAALAQTVGSEPICVPGNHDVRPGGIGLQQAERPLPFLRVTKCSAQGITFVSFDSIREAELLARGRIGRTQMDEARHELDARDPLGASWLRIALLHHHPQVVHRPAWLAQDWYSKLLPSGVFKLTDELADASEFLAWCKANRIDLILHGHKHIPHIFALSSPAIVGAGSSTGCMEFADRSAILSSINVLTLNQESRRISAVLYVEGENELRREVGSASWRFD